MTSIPHVASFGARFLSELDRSKNSICSPLSAETVLALVALGSNNESRAEILNALDIRDEDTIRSTFTSLTTTLSKEPETPTSQAKTSDNVTLKIANKIYVKQGNALKAGLEKDAEEVFQSSLEQIDFSKSSDAANAINKWVANQTNNKIKEIVAANMLSGDTGLVLVNAIYFHGFWEIQFKANDTYTRPFNVNSNKKINIEQMRKCLNYKHSPELKAKILQMFYVGGTASMVIVLPDEIEGLSDVIKHLTDGHDLMADINSLEKTYLKVLIPKFTVETEINLKELLPKMGIKTIFDKNKSEVNMLATNEKLYVSEGIQKAFIAVNEKGTEAAAATGLRVRKCCRKFWTDTFVADRPFLYLLTTHDIPLFYGTFLGSKNIE